ncbi:MAG: hypothetical protein JWN34_805 [Bryobacterales bacterium]|nr:hypothetical protein [Bryobacterales bacterium]
MTPGRIMMRFALKAVRCIRRGVVEREASFRLADSPGAAEWSAVY